MTLLEHKSTANGTSLALRTHWLSGVNFPVNAFSASCATTPPRNAHSGAKQPRAVNARYCSRLRSNSFTCTQTTVNTAQRGHTWHRGDVGCCWGHLHHHCSHYNHHYLLLVGQGPSDWLERLVSDGDVKPYSLTHLAGSPKVYQIKTIGDNLWEISCRLDVLPVNQHRPMLKERRTHRLQHRIWK